MYESIDDLTAPWMGNGADLARRMLALADDYADSYAINAAFLAREMYRVVRCDYNPLPHLPELGDPPTIRPAVPPRGRHGWARGSAES